MALSVDISEFTATGGSGREVSVRTGNEDGIRDAVSSDARVEGSLGARW
jgi:hypothetical protein